VREGRRPERTIYEITEAGHREAVDWMLELLSVSAKEYPQFMAALSFLGVLSPDEVAAALRERAAAIELRLVQSRSVEAAAAKAGLPRLFRLEGEYEEQLLVAEQAFVQRLVDEIEVGTLEGLDAWRRFQDDGEEIHVELHFGEEAPTDPAP
jgi:DNA-binding PadR family transcriptional regulator